MFFLFVSNAAQHGRNVAVYGRGGCVDYAAMGKKIRRKRREMDITQEQLAALAGISTAFVGHIERGTRVLSVETLYRLCKVLGLAADYLMGI